MSADFTCRNCSADHDMLVRSVANLWTCSECKCQWDQEQRTDEIPWRCFHCGEAFNTNEDASGHFGFTDYDTPACRIAPDLRGLVLAFREQEAELRRYRNEDHESARNFYRIGGDHATALKREEEKGYAKGLADLRKLIATCKHEYDETPGLGEFCRDCGLPRPAATPSGEPVQDAAVAKDAERYRWLRYGDNDEAVMMTAQEGKPARPFDPRFDASWLLRDERLDTAIDVAIAVSQNDQVSS